MTRRLMILALTMAGCSGGGESTTAAETVADTGSTSAPADTSSGTNPAETGTDSPDGTTAGDTTTGACPEVTLEGEWLSEGDDVAPLLVDLLGLVSVQAIFDEVSFEVNSTDGAGAMGQQTGTYTTELCPGSGTKFRIVLDQTAPNAIMAEGIFEIDGCMDPAMMRYEVIQTQPDVGALAPTCDDDFGAGAFGADNIQIFVRQ